MLLSRSRYTYGAAVANQIKTKTGEFLYFAKVINVLIEFFLERLLLFRTRQRPFL